MTIKIKRANLKKTRLLLGAIMIITLSLCAIFTFTACNKKDKPTAVFETMYDLSIEFDKSMRKVSLNQEVMFTNNTGTDLNSLVFRLYPNAFKSLSSDKSGKIDVLSAKIDNQSIDFVISKEDETILTLPHSVVKNETCNVAFECAITLPVSDKRFGVTAKSYNLTGFYPVLSIFENGAWRTDKFTDIGDPFFSEASSFYVSATMPDTYQAATSGAITDVEKSNGLVTYEIAAENIRDYALIVGNQFKTETLSVPIGSSDVNIRYLYYTDSSAKDTVKVAADALKAFSAAFGNYPYADFTVVQTPLSAGGMEYGSLVQVAPSTSRVAYIDTVIHETAHQWWYGVVGSDQINVSWLDEGLTEFCTGYFYRLNGNNARHTAFVDGLNDSLNIALAANFPGATGNMEKDLSSFASDDEYVLSTYVKGALLFETLRALIGDNNFNKVLSTYYADNFLKIAGKDALYTAFKKHGYAVNSLIDNYLTGKSKL